MTTCKPPLSILAAGLLLAAAPAAAQPAHVRVAEVAVASVAPSQRVTGSLRARHEATIAAREEGALLTVPFLAAARVKQGATLATLDTRRLEASLCEIDAEIARVNAEVLQRKAELALAERDLQALEQALEQNAVAERQVRTARMEAAVAAARVKSAEAQIESLAHRRTVIGLRIEDAAVYAPFDGRIVARFAEPGEWIRPGEPIVGMISTGVVEAWLDVPERFAEHLAGGGRAAEVFLEPSGRKLKVLGIRKLPNVQPRARTFPLIVEVDDEDGLLIPGMSVSARVEVGPGAARVLVPLDALVRRHNGVSVYRVRRSESEAFAEQVFVNVQFERTEDAAVEAGLQAGDLVVIEGSERLRNGQPLIVVAGPEGGREPNGGSGR